MDQKEKDFVIAWKTKLEARVKEINDELDGYQQIKTESQIKKDYIEDAIARGNTDLRRHSESFRNTFDYENVSNVLKENENIFSEKSKEYDKELKNLNYMISHINYMLKNE